MYDDPALDREAGRLSRLALPVRCWPIDGSLSSDGQFSFDGQISCDG